MLGVVFQENSNSRAKYTSGFANRGAVAHNVSGVVLFLSAEIAGVGVPDGASVGLGDRVDETAIGG